MFVLLMSFVSANAVTTLTTCGEPVGGWVNGETYVINIPEINSSLTSTQYCYDLTGTDNWDKSLTFTTNNNEIKVNSKTLFYFNYNATSIDIQNFKMSVSDNSIVNDNPTFAMVNKKPYICTTGSCNTY